MIITLCGFANSGKSTIAQHLVNRHGFVRASFAAGVKDVAAAAFGWKRIKLEGITPEDREWREEPDLFWSGVKSQPFSPREGLQLIGGGFRELFHKDLWVQNTIRFIKDNWHKHVVIDDMRYCNERNALEDIGAKTFAVFRDFPTPEHKRVWDLGFTGNGIPDSTLHISEWDWLRHPSVSDLTTPVVVNYGSVEDLQKLTNMMYNRLLTEAVKNHPFTMKATEAF